AVIEVFEETQSVLLPCLYGGVIPEDPFVIWTRNDHNSKVFLFRQEGSDPEGQNQIYRGRTSMSPDALETGNYSLTFRKPELTDSGNYICSIADGVKTIKLTEVQLNVKGQLFRTSTVLKINLGLFLFYSINDKKNTLIFGNLEKSLYTAV
uniref:Ig-like domain-containing protein n=1 Tax=Xiphophorus maculatus TaxID=8083 RepID=A0A3B5QRV0_XIPMA